MSSDSIKRLFFIVFLYSSAVHAQKEQPIQLVNPSFEDLPKCCEAPTGWYNCGKPTETPPDVQPGSFQVTKAASHGETYLGLVVRDDDSWESVCQRLSKPLEKDHCYEFSLDLCRAEIYLSLSKSTGQEVNYNAPAKLRIWGGTGYCDKKELLAETSVITHFRWLAYNFRFNPKKASYSYLFIEAYYKTPTLFPANGNILIDNASEIKPVPCEKKPAVADQPKKKPKTTPEKQDTQQTAQAPKQTPTQNNSGGKFDRRNLKKGQTIRLDKIYFPADKAEISQESTPALEEVLDFLNKNSDVVVEIGGHTNLEAEASYAETLSGKRAKAVADWLIFRGITEDRVKYKGYGKRYPIDRTKSGRARNQRVEIKILNINGSN